MTDASNAAITSQTDIANLQSFRYRGYYYDSNSGFYYLQSRYYDPVTHRFLNADGLVSTGTGVLGYNMFAYCENNPVNCSDYDGYRFDDSFGGGGGIAVPISYGSGGGSYIGYTVLGTTAAIIGLVSTKSTADIRKDMFALRRTKVKSKAQEKELTDTSTSSRDNRKTYYHSTTRENALQIIATQVLLPSSWESNHVYAWSTVPNSYAIKNSGARTGALISFKTYSAFEPDPNINDPRVKMFGPMISVNQGPIQISEVKIIWWEK